MSCNASGHSSWQQLCLLTMRLARPKGWKGESQHILLHTKKAMSAACYIVAEIIHTFHLPSFTTGCLELY